MIRELEPEKFFVEVKIGFKKVLLPFIGLEETSDKRKLGVS